MINNSKIDRYKKLGQKMFKKIGDTAIGNAKLGEDTTPVPFTFIGFPYEKPMPKRRVKKI